MELNLELIQQLNGDVRIDDAGEGPLLKVEFFAEFASTFSEEEKYQVLETVFAKVREFNV